MQAQTALLLFSGGQDSTICLAWALERFACVQTLGFDYDQRHAVELQCRQTLRAAFTERFPQWRARLGADHLLALPALSQVSESSLTSATPISARADGLPNTFVPARNLIFLSFAAALAEHIGAHALVGGMCQTDYSGYPDCRADFIAASEKSIALALGHTLPIHTPLMLLDKAQSWAMAQSLGGAALVDLILEGTHTCYLGERTARHDWGYGCGACPACNLRACGYALWRSSGAAGAVGLAGAKSERVCST